MTWSEKTDSASSFGGHYTPPAGPLAVLPSSKQLGSQTLQGHMLGLCLLTSAWHSMPSYDMKQNLQASFKERSCVKQTPPLCHFCLFTLDLSLCDIRQHAGTAEAVTSCDAILPFKQMTIWLCKYLPQTSISYCIKTFKNVLSFCLKSNVVMINPQKQKQKQVEDNDSKLELSMLKINATYLKK